MCHSLSFKEKPQNFAWAEELSSILFDWKEGSDEPLDGDEVDRLAEVIRAKLNYMEGNCTWDEYLGGEIKESE